MQNYYNYYLNNCILKEYIKKYGLRDEIYILNSSKL